MSLREPEAYLFDIDGTLVDSNYHHCIAWFRSFRDCDITVPIWHLHRAIGMGGDMFVAHVTDESVEEKFGDRLRDGWTRYFDEMIDEVQPFADAASVIRALKADHAVALASSGQRRHVETFLKIVGISPDEVDAVLTSDDVDRSKPHTDLLDAAMERLGTRDAVMIGDSVWDCEAAGRAGVPVIGTLGGGFGRDELVDAGADRVVTTLSELVDGGEGRSR